MTNIKKALEQYILADLELMSVMKRVFPVFNPVSSSQLNKTILKAIYPNITIVEVKPERSYCENGLNKGFRKTEVQIDFTDIIDVSKFTSSIASTRQSENEKIYTFDKVIEDWKQKISTDYEKPAEMHGAAIHQVIITDELATDEEIDSAIAENFTFYREAVRLSIIYNPIINTGE